MHILIDGTSGFIGGLLVPKLKEAGHEVETLERYVSSRYGRLDRDPTIKTHFVNLTDYSGIVSTFKETQPETIIHLAALTPVSFSYTHPIETIETNYVATVNLAEAARIHDKSLKHFIFASTTETYGNTPDRPATETSRFWPNSPYASAKLAAMNYLQYMNRTYDFPMTAVLATNTYGRLNDTHFFIERMMAQMIAGGPVKLGDPAPIRDFMHCSDHVSAYIDVLNNRDKSIGQLFNISTGKNLTIGEAADIVKGIVGYDGEILWGQVPKRPNDIFNHSISSDKIRRELGWSHRVEFEDGIKLLLQQMRATQPTN